MQPTDPGGALERVDPASLVSSVAFLMGAMSELVGASTADLPDALDRVVALLGQYTDVDRVGLVRIDHERMTMELEHSWHSDRVGPDYTAARSLPLAEQPGLTDRLRKKLIITTGDSEHMAPELAADQESMRRRGIRANAVVPVVLGDEVHGLLFLDDHARPRHWDDLLPTLRAIGQALAGALGRRDASNRLERSEHRFKSLFDDNPLPVLVLEAETLRIIEVNRSACDHYGYGPSHFIGHPLSRLHVEDEHVRLEELQMVRGRSRSGPWHHVLASGAVIVVELLLRASFLDGRQVQLCVVHDITDQRNLERQLRHQAFHDGLTGLANRALLEERLNHALSARDAEVALLVLDLDGFKTVNDSLGHQAGDQLLMMAADRLRSAVRDHDTVARLGGDEFAVLVQTKDPLVDARAIAVRATEVLSRPFMIDGVDAVVSVSIGLSHRAIGPLEASSSELLLRDADLAMYAAKEAGRGRFVEFSAGLEASAQDRLRLVADIHHALERNELALHYQPTVDLASTKVLGVEALLRWFHPELGLIAPGRYLPLIEESPLIGKLGNWVLQEACRQIREWSDDLGDAPVVAINVAPRQLRDPDFVESVRSALGTHGVSAAKLIIEITERSLIDDAATIARLQELRDLGLRLAIDDFGTGYSSLSYLRRLPVDILKIDRSFVTALDLEPERSAAVVAAITELASVLGLETIAEGIEEPTQREALQQMGCTVGQGYLFARPAPPGELMAYLRSHAR